MPNPEKRRRVVITGIGVIAPNGIGKERFWEALKNGVSGVHRITRFDPSPYPTQVAAEVNGFNPTDWMEAKDIIRTDRSTHFAVAAAKMAAEDANYTPQENEKAGVAIGTAMGGLIFALDQHAKMIKRGPLQIDPFIVNAFAPNTTSGQISIEMKATGPSQTFSNTCASSFDAIGYALERIRSGEMDVMIAGGTDAPLFPLVFDGFCLTRIMTTQNSDTPAAPAPFDRERDGTVVGEGSGVLIFEEEKHALRRGAPIYAELAGYSSSCDAYHAIRPEPTGRNASRNILAAFKEAGIEPEEIDFISAHGSGTVEGDKIEAKIITQAFGKHSFMVPTTAFKSMIGHTQGADGTLELVATLLSMKNNLIPPTINYRHPDPECLLNIVTNRAQPADINTVLLNCIAFLGKNAALVIRKYKE